MRSRSRLEVCLPLCPLIRQWNRCWQASSRRGPAIQEATGYQPTARPERRRKMGLELSESKSAAFQILTAALQQPGVYQPSPSHFPD